MDRILTSKSSPPAASPDQGTSVDHVKQYAAGNQTFALLFTRWMDTNGWSHPKMVGLSKACMGGVGWLHSSQINGLRHGKLPSPGPRTFIAIERLNYYVHRYATEKKLIPNTTSSNDYATAYAITENGKAPPLGWWAEVFAGQRVPTDIELHQNFFTPEQAAQFSERWAALARRCMTIEGVDLITELDKTVREHYQTREADRVAQLIAVLQNRDTWTPSQLTVELPVITSFIAAFGGPSTEDQLIHQLR